MTQFGNRHSLEEIKVKKADRLIELTFEDGKCFRLSAELLRVESPSAEVQGHSPADKKLVAGRQHVGIIAVEPVGNYAIKIGFDDLHDSGLYTWDYLYALGENQDRIWADYLAQLDAAGLSRNPAENPPPPPTHGCGGGGKGGCG